MRLWTVLPLLAVLFALPAHGSLAAEWTIDKVQISPSGTEGYGQLHASLHQQPGHNKEINASTISNHLLSAFTFKDKLVLFGDAGRAQSVEIFRISTGDKVDWFICYDQWRVSANLIASTEFYHTLAAGTPVDVVLAYDLTKTPRENRLTQPPHIPPELSDQPTSVGIPIYPPENASSGSYRNRLADAHARFSVVGSSYLVSDARWLTFETIQFVDERRTGSAIVVVDLSHGLLHAKSSTTLVEAIPTSDVKIISVREVSPRKLQAELTIDGKPQTQLLDAP